ncbi:DYH6 protein, partial [Atractosteus spatula]|nr:DYH6 protein [Atractosteus spatula]
MARDIFCGQMRDSLVGSLRSQLSEVFTPLLRVQKHWGSCPPEHVTQFLAELDRYAVSLQDSTGAVSLERQQILKKPTKLVSPDVTQKRSAAFDSDVIGEHEALVSEWMKIIEHILHEGGDDRVLDINTSPFTELERWRRRQRTLESITEQLRGKESKTVIGLLISTKSRLLKKWKAVDISITDVTNDTKSKVKYLEALQRHFDALAREKNPVNLMDSVLPGMIVGIKQMDAISRSFARNGYLGILLTKVCNQLTVACREFLKADMVKEETDDRLWHRVKEEMEKGSASPLQPGFPHKNKGKEKKPQLSMQTHTLYERIQACLTLQAFFLDAVRQLRDALGGAHGMHRFSSSSSLSTMQGKLTSYSVGRAPKSSVRKASVTSSYDHSHDCQGTGISLTDEETIMHNMDTLCCKLRQFANVILTLQQYKELSEHTEGLQKPSREDLFINDNTDGESTHDQTDDPQTKEEYLETLKTDTIPHGTEPYHLQTLIEEDEAQSGGLPSAHSELQSLKTLQDEGSSEPLQPTCQEGEEENGDGLTNEEKHMLRNLYNWEDLDEEGASLSAVIGDCVNNMIDTMASVVSTGVLLDVEKKDTDQFEEAYSNFLVMNQQLESYISVYIQALFLRKLNTREALSILHRFSVVSQRQGIQPMINECYVEALDWFYEEIKEVQEIYEKYKDDPVLPKNMPPASGAIYWSRQLLSRIDGPMKVFKGVRVVASSYSYSQAVQLYNRIAAALVAFEHLWYQKWRSEVDGCLLGLKATLLVRHPLTGEFMVNCDERVIQLFEETKWMIRFRMEVPLPAMLSLKQERKFKTYRSNLQDLLQELQSVKKEIPECLATQFAFPLESVGRHLQPGLSVLTWSSIDIEAFLHNVHTDISRLKIVVEKISKMKAAVIDKTLSDIQKLVLFNTDEILFEQKSPQEFLHILTSSLKMKQVELEEKVKTIQTAISDIRAVLKANKAASHQTLPKGNQTACTASSSSSYHNSDDSSRPVSEYFRDQTCKAILCCICHSLLILARVSGCDLDRLAEKHLCHQEEGCPIYSSSNVSLTTRTENLRNTVFPVSLRFTLRMRLTIPTIVTDPSVESAQHALIAAASAVMDVTDSLKWNLGEDKNDPLPLDVRGEETIQHILGHLSNAINGLKPLVDKHIFQYSQFDFLWKDDMNSQFSELTETNCELFIIVKEVERLQKIEQKIIDIPLVFQTGCLWLDTSPIKDALRGFAGVWKVRYASVLHQDVKKRLDEVIRYKKESYQQLLAEVISLEELNISLCLLEELLDMENKIDGMYQPIESTYQQLRSFDLRLPRQEVMEVMNLRSNWAELMALADRVRRHLLKDKKTMFEQELDKQVKGFAVDVIQLRNSFDTQGPAAPRLSPEEAVKKLQIFQEKFQVYDAKRKTLNSLQRLFSITPKAFPELDRTGKDLLELGTLYELFQKFLSFNERFRDTLWAKADLKQSNEEVMNYWSQCLAEKDRLKDWDPYHEMAAQIQFYIDSFPILHKLAAKDIRNRHWLEVMAVTGSSFPLEATVFKLHHLLDVELMKHQAAITSIATAAREELQLEVKMRAIEEEWTEQVLSFEAYRTMGPVLLGKEDTLLTLEQAEHARLLLAQMLTSPHIGPLKEEAASWTDKLKEVGNILELWLEVQDLWRNLEPVFSDANLSKELPQEAKRFAKVERTWIKMMHSAYRTRNVLQCCCATEVPKEVILLRMRKDLEVCCQFLSHFLEMKRQAFPRFYFLPDLVLLSFLSHPRDVGLLRNHFGLIFSGVASLALERSDSCSSSCSSEPADPHFSPRAAEGLESASYRSLTRMTDSDSLFPKSLRSAGLSLESPIPLSSREATQGMMAVSVIANDGECLQLGEEVYISSAVEEWLSDLQSSIQQTLERSMTDATLDMSQGVGIDEWTYKHPFQIARLCLLYCWTRDCEAAITNVKSDRKALPGAVKKHSGMIFKLSNIISKGSWNHCEEPVTASQKLKLENMIMFAVYLRDVMESLSTRKVREITDFEWRRALRVYSDEKDDKRHFLCIHNAQYECGYEFYGAEAPVIMTPATEKSFLALSYTQKNLGGAAVLGDHGTGKTETLKGFAHLLGKFLLLFHCSYHSNPASITKILHGAAMDGCWVCFDDFHLLKKSAVSAVMFNSQTLYDCLKAKLNTCVLGDGKEVTLNGSLSLFVTAHCRPGGETLPSDVLALFRTVSLAAPDRAVILRGTLAAFGFKSPRMLTHRILLVSQLTQEQLPEGLHHLFSLASLVSVVQRAAQKKAERRVRAEGRQNHAEVRMGGERTSRSSSVTSTLPFAARALSPSLSLKTVQSMDRKTAAIHSNAMTSAARLDHALVGETLHECLGPRMKGDDVMVFDQIVKDMFGCQLDASVSEGCLHSENALDGAILTAAKNISLVPHVPWVKKVKQLYRLSQCHQGIIVAGPPGAGKSSCISTLIRALNLLPLDQQTESPGIPSEEQKELPSHKLVKFNPQATDDCTLLFGFQAPHVWIDSIVTYAWRKAIRQSGISWLCFDGTLTPTWADNFSSVLETKKVLQLSNGEHLPLTSNIRLLFETSDLELASPALISRAGIIYVDSDTTGWRPLAKIWLAQRNEQENKVLSQAFNSTLDPIFNFVLHDVKLPVPLTEVGLFQTITSLLQAMLNDKAQSLGGPLHIERLFLFCLIWLVGGLLKSNEKKKFGEILKARTANLPDCDDEISVFDYYVDESGEWDPWQSRMSQHSSLSSPDGLGEVFVETIDTLAVRIFLEYADMASQNVLLVGSRGCGKSALLNDFINTQEKTNFLTKRMIFSGSSKAKNLQEMFEQSIVHRQGFLFGAKDGKTLQIFIDDINLPETQCCELLRQVLDDKVLFKLTKPFEKRQIEDVVVQATMSLPESLSGNTISKRLLRQFAVLYLPHPEGYKLNQVVFTVLQANMAKNNGQQLENSLHSALVSASCSLLESIKTVLRPSTDLGRQHYAFSLKEMTRAFESLCILSPGERRNADGVISLWHHEVKHIVGDRLCRHADLSWFQQQLKSTIEKEFSMHQYDLQQNYVTFPLDETVNNQLAEVPDLEVKVRLQAVKGFQEVKSCVQSYVQQYNKELGNNVLDIQLSENTLAHVVRIHRALVYQYSGNLLVVGSPGSHLRTLLKLALFVSHIPLHNLDASQPAQFFSSLKSAVRLTAEGKTAALLLTARELTDESYLDAINSILISGDYVPLFTPEEIRDILQVLNPALPQNPAFARDPNLCLASRVKSNLHMIMCLPPDHTLLKTASVRYPGFLSGCHVLWICDWKEEAVLREAEHFISTCDVLEKMSEGTRKKVASTMASIHHQMLTECQQVPWAGYCGPTLTLDNFTVQKTESDSKETAKTETLMVPNLPYSAAIVKESIGVLLKNEHKSVYNKVFCGPSTFRHYLETFSHIYFLKCTELEKTRTLLRNALETLEQSRIDAQSTQDLIKHLVVQYEDAKYTASQLLYKLSARASALEQLKGKLGIGAESLKVFLAQVESGSEEIEMEALLKDSEDEFDQYDEAFFQMKEVNTKSHLSQLDEDLRMARNEMEEARNRLTHAKTQVMHWCNKVDRSCIERVSRCQNPPFLLVQVMEMVLVMLDLIPCPADTERETPRLKHPGETPEAGHSQKSSRGARTAKRWPARGFGKSSNDKVDRSRWKALQSHVGDSSKFVDMLQNVARQEAGLPSHVLERVESYLGKTTEGSLGVTGEGSLLENAAPHASPQSIAPARRLPAESGARRGEITIAAARYSSEEAAALVALVAALVEYTKLCGPLRSTLEQVHVLETQKEDRERNHEETLKLVDAEEEDLKEIEPLSSELTAEDLPKLESEVEEIQAEYDAAIMNKHTLETELQTHREKLRSAQDVLRRHLASELFMQTCVEGGLSPPRKLLFSDITLRNFLNSPELQTQLDTCLTDGLPLLLTYCDPKALALDQRFATVLRSRMQFVRSGTPFKITVADHEVECHPGFRLLLHTTSRPEEIPAEIAAFCTILHFYQDRQGLSEQLLDRFVQLEKSRLSKEYATLQKECLDNMEDLQTVEEKIAETLSQESSLLHHLAINRTLSDLHQHYDEALEMKSKLALLEKTALTAREGFRDLADRAALMFDTANTMRQVNPAYHISFSQLLEVFDSSAVHSERFSIKTLVDRLTYNIFCYIGRYMLERDQMVYTLLLAFEIESGLGHISPGMIEFVLSPDLCASLMEATKAKPSETRQTAKNPFEWMTEEQFKNVQILGTYYSWFHDLFDRMFKDGKEMTWKALCDSDQPENRAKVKGPEGLSSLTALQRLLVVRAIRSDRLIQAASLFIGSTLGKKYVTEIPSDLQRCVQQTTAQTPVLLLYSSEAEEPRRLVLELGSQRSCKTEVVFVSEDSASEERRIKDVIENGQSKGSWVLLENIHNSMHLMTSIESLIHLNKIPNKQFRLWISAQANTSIPVRLMHVSLRIVVDTPKNMKDAMLRCLQQVGPDTLRSCSRAEWPALIHNLCYLHCAVRLRSTAGGTAGWNFRRAMMFGVQEFRDALQVLREEFRDGSTSDVGEGRSVSWTGIRYLLTNVIYGKNITDDCDKRSLASLVDLWISSTATKKDNDMTKLRYRIPAAFFDPDVPLEGLLQALDSVPRHALDVPEGTSLHSAPGLHFGDEQYAYQWLKTLYKSLSFHHQQHSLAVQRHCRDFLMKSRKEEEVWEICCNIQAKIPKGWSKDFINERLKKIGGNTPFNLFLKKELNHLMELLSEVKRNLQAIRQSTEGPLRLGGTLSVTELSVAADLFRQRVPTHWSSLEGQDTPPEHWATATWVRDLQQRVLHFEKILQLGQEKMPTYWLGAFKNPKGLLGVFRQQSIQQHAEQTGFIEPMDLHTVITQRDKDHIRDPPQEGVFVYGLHVWGVSWHKTEAELLDAPPKHGPVALPVIHLRFLPKSEKAGLGDAARAADSYQCPVYGSSAGPRGPVLHLQVYKENIPAARWALRGMKATLQPF